MERVNDETTDERDGLCIVRIGSFIKKPNECWDMVEIRACIMSGLCENSSGSMSHHSLSPYNLTNRGDTG